MTATQALRVPLATLAVIVLGIPLRFTAGPAWAERFWLACLVLAGAPIVWRTLRDAARGRFATDVVAMLAILTAVILRQPVAGLVIVLMQTGGEALEQFAAARASAALNELEAAAPRQAHRVGTVTTRPSSQVEDVDAAEVQVGDLLLIRPGELVPCDSIVLSGHSAVDASRLTGEPVPIDALPGTTLMSGSVNGDGALSVRATALAAESQYARIVELVRRAQASKAPLQRLADRYAVWFTPLTLGVCAVVYMVSGDWLRVLAVLVVATPCPLILATPIAIIGGISRAARRQIIVRHGGALESLATVDTAVFDKTGTLTLGRPEVSAVVPVSGIDEDALLRLAAAAEQHSSHPLARTVVNAAHARGIALPVARGLVEAPGRGVYAVVDGRDVSVGARTFLIERHGVAETAIAALEESEVGLRAYVAVDGCLAGLIEFADRPRPGLAAFFQELATLGIDRTVLLSGDHLPNVRAVARAVGITEARGELLPGDKVVVVTQLARAGRHVMMVGDGTNDAPALSAADVGVALAAHGGGITTEAADVVLLVDELPRVAEAIRIGRRTMRVARESIWVGLGLSGAAMLLAANGLIVPTVGAVLQEVIDVAVILNALRTLR
jgi:heavy metal translocating P-type ATPase